MEAKEFCAAALNAAGKTVVGHLNSEFVLSRSLRCNPRANLTLVGERVAHTPNRGVSHPTEILRGAKSLVALLVVFFAIVRKQKKIGPCQSAKPLRNDTRANCEHWLPCC